ncbi:MAG TPA: HAD family hydrolase [Bacillota bacterium]|nr:HAD family hydrolase [Bacillota bacterium]
MFVFDIDGTLLSSQEEILPNTLLSLQKLNESGHPVALCTGRTWACTEPIFKQISPWVDYIICGNGSHIRSSNQTIIYDNNLPPHFIKQFIELVAGLADFLIATNRMVISTSNFTPYNDVSHCIRLFDFSLFHTQIHAKNLLAYNIEQIPSCDRKEIRARLEGIDPTIKLSPTSNFWEVLSGTDNKALALRRLSIHAGIPLEQFTAFGDNHNDIEMFKVVGKSVVMGNAPSKVMEYAHYITKSNNQDGIYDYLNKYVFN